MAVTAENWVAQIKQASENFEICLEENWTDDTCGWGARLQTLWDQDESLRPFGLLLTGPEGCGRHTAAAHVVRFLWDKEWISIWLSGHDLLSGGGLPTAREYLDALLDDFRSQKQGLCLVLERLEGWTERRELLAYLGQKLWDYWRMQDEYPPLFLILIDSERDIPGLLRGRLQQCRMTLPDREQRRQFLKNRGAGSGLTKYVPADAFADNTEGFTYAQLLDLVGNLCMLVYQTDRSISAEELKQLAAEQRVEQPAVRSAQRRAALEEALIRLADELPELLRSMPISNGAQVRNHTPTQPEATKPVSASSPTSATTYEELERMPVSQLVKDLFGEELGEQLLQ